MLQLITLVLWTGCAAVGGLGVVLHYQRPKPPIVEAPALVAEVLQVQLDNSPVPQIERTTPENLMEPAPLFAPAPPPNAPPLLAVADPAAVAFAMPVDGPVQVVDAKYAAHSRREETAVPASPVAPPVQSIVYGQGEGRQPAPEYPWQAKREGQEGTVVVQMLVDEAGRVLQAQAVKPSPWPLLNDAALRAVRKGWKFRRGEQRLYEVAIRFELKK